VIAFSLIALVVLGAMFVLVLNRGANPVAGGCIGLLMLYFMFMLLASCVAEAVKDDCPYEYTGCL
jgi:hypothetical protein